MSEILLEVADRLDGATPQSTGCARSTEARLAELLGTDDLVTTYRTLRSRMLRSWLQARGPAETPDADQLVRFDEILDESLSSAIRHRREPDVLTRLAESEQRFRALVNATSQAIYRLSPDGTQMRELEGRGTVENTDNPNASWLNEYIHPADQQRAVEVFREARRNRSLFEFEHRYRRLDGRIGWTLSRAVPLLDENGRIIEWFGAASDITGRRLAQEALREADRSKDEFLAVLGHELRSPLAPLRTSIDLLEQARTRPALLDELRGRMDRQLSHLVRLVDDLLDISRISRGEITLQPVPLDLNAPVRAAIEQAKPAIAARRHTLRLRLSSIPVPVRGDHVRLTQVVVNLLSNAAKYMDPGGTITVCSTMDDGKAVVRVLDTGYGIPPERFGRLFKLFSRIEEHAARTGGGGLGVGLALSRQLLALHGGSIEVHSEGFGHGSEFVLRLDASTEVPPAATGAPAGSTAPSSRRVMIVEDNVDAAESLRVLLQLKGHEVQVAYDGPAALEQVQAFQPQVVLLDLGLPGMSGVEVAERIRRFAGGGRVIIVAVTGWGQSEDRQRTADAGFDDHVTKPVSLAEIDRVLALGAR